MKQLFYYKLHTRIFAFIMALAVMFSSITVYGQDNVAESGSGEEIKSENVFTEGTGTSDDPYLVKTAVQLQAINDGLDKSYKLVNDIDLTDVDFCPIGSEDNPFTGNFDGDGYSLVNLVLEEAGTTNNYVGLFGVTSGATINDVNISACDIKGTAVLTDYKVYVGALVGKCIDSYISGVSVNSGYVEAVYEVNGGYVGGIAAVMEDSDISDCVNYAELDGDSVAGIVHTMNGASYLNNCINYGRLYGEKNVYGNIVHSGVSDNISYCLYMKTCANVGKDRDYDGVIDITDVHKEESSYTMFDTDNLWDLTEEGIMVLKSNKDYDCSFIDTIEAKDMQISINSSKEVETDIKTNDNSCIFGLKYEVQDTSIASVDKYGFVTVKKAGTTIVKVTDVVSGKSTTCKLTVDALKQIKMLKNSFEYTGQPIEPKDNIFVMDYSDKVLEYGVDYKLEYTNNLHVGTATVKAIGMGDYSGVLESQFTITTKDIAKANLEVDGFFRSMDAQMGNLSLSVKADGRLLEYGKDYSFMYDMAAPIDYTKSVVEVDISFWGGDYEGFTKKKIDLSKNNLTGITSKGYKGTYDGKAHSIQLSGVPSGATVYYIPLHGDLCNGYSKTKPYFTNITDNGVSYLVRKEGYNDYFGTESVIIKPIDLKKASVALSFTEKTYTGKFIHNKMTIYMNGVKLVENRDYQYVDAGGIYPGTAYVMAEGIGNYTGYSPTRTFRIKPPKSAVPSKATVKMVGHDDVKITWTKVNGACGYEVYYKSSKMKSYKKLCSTNKLSYKKKNLADGLKFSFRVYPCKKFGGKSCRMDDYKQANSITTLKKIKDVKVVKSGSKKVKVSWSNIEGETGYQISRTTTTGGSHIVATYKTSSGKSKVVNAPKKRRYYFKVRAYKTVDGKKIYGPWSEVKKFKMK